MLINSKYTLQSRTTARRERSAESQASPRGKVNKSPVTHDTTRKIHEKYAWLTLTLGVRDRDDDCQQQRQEDQHQFTPHRLTSAAAATTVVDDASRIGAPGIARHVPETPLAGWLPGCDDRDSRKRHDNTMLLTTRRTLFARWKSRVCRSRAHTPHSRYRPPSPTDSERADRCDTSEVGRPPLSPTTATSSRGAAVTAERARSRARRDARDSNAISAMSMYYFRNR